MENTNTNQTENNPNNNASRKSREVFIIILFTIMVAVAALAAVNYFSSWKCVGGEWLKDGFPLSRKPQGACESQKVVKSADKATAGTSEVIEAQNSAVNGNLAESQPSEPELVQEKAKKNDDYLPVGCPHDPQDDPILGDCGMDCDTSLWKTYKNKKYGYSFCYDSSFKITNSCKNTSCISEQQGGDFVMLQGDISEKGWPLIEITHYATEAYNPPAGANETEWIKEKFPETAKCFPSSANIYFTREEGHLLGGFNLYFPKSPQTYSRREIFYSYKGELFQIMMLDVNDAQARQFYNNWLSAFHIAGE